MHGARLPKLHAFHSPHLFFGTYLMILFRVFGFRRPCTKILSRHSMDTLNCAPDGASVRSRSPSRSLEVEPSWSCATCKRGPYAQARALACVHCLTCAPMAADALLRLKEERRHQGCACPAPPPSHRAAAHPAPDELISRRLCTGVALTSENVSRFPQGVARPQAASQDDSGPSTGIGQSCARTRTV